MYKFTVKTHSLSTMSSLQAAVLPSMQPKLGKLVMSFFIAAHIVLSTGLCVVVADWLLPRVSDTERSFNTAAATM